MEKRRLSSRTRGWVITVASVAAGYFFFYLLFNVFVGEAPLGNDDIPGALLDGKTHLYNLNTLHSTGNALANGEKVLLLTPMAVFYPQYFENILKLTFPHNRIELGFIVPDNKHGDDVLKELMPALKAVQTDPKVNKRFRKVHVLRQDTPSPSSQKEQDRHKMEFQKERRSQQAMARNTLLFSTLGPDISWVLWLDSDVVETPPTLIQDLTSKDKDVIVANCWQRYKEKGENKVRAYDFNSWVDSDTAQEIAKNLGPDELLLEGYSEMATYRTLMAHLYDPSKPATDLMELDGVGATALLVRSDVHRDGAMFPPFVFHHLIESEGFAKMAKRLGYKVWGLPNYLVYHYNE